MAVFLAPDPIQGCQLIPGGNTPASGGKLFFYIAGSSTKQTVYSDSAGSVSHTNPIVLDSGGNIPSGGEVWFTSGVTYKVIFAPSTDSDPPVSPYWTKDNLSGINDVGAQTGVEWVGGPTPTFVSTTSFTVAGDQTSTFMVGRRVKTTNTGGTIYSTIIASVFGAVTTVTVRNDSGVLDAGLSAVSYGLLSATDISIPLLKTSQWRVSGTSDVTKLLALNIEQFASSTVRTVSVADRSFTIGKPPSTTSFAVVTTGTYTTPTDSVYIWVRMVGGGGGGGAANVTTGTNGSSTTFGALTAGGGLFGGAFSAGGVGGTATGGDVNIRGAQGAGGGTTLGATQPFAACGGNSAFFGGAGSGGITGVNGSSGVAGTGGGGGGGGQNGTNTGSGGGAGGYVEKYFASPSSGTSTYTWSVGAGGTGGAAGGTAGGNGGSGQIIVIEYYS